MAFPKEFFWGAATASYQIEGGKSTRGESVWDQFCRIPGKTLDGHDGSVACDHYHRFREDIGLMKELGLGAYRFSFSWPRVQPGGAGAPSAEGLDFYDRLVDGLLEAGVTPWATLFHWDYPLEKYHAGGWLNGDSPAWFADYASILADRFGDRITNWMTFNEPQCFIGLGHFDGIHAPGLRLGYEDLFRIIRNYLLANGRATQILRASNAKARVGIAGVSNCALPYREVPEDIAAAFSYSFEEGGLSKDYWFQPFYIDPIVLGTWPQFASEKLAPGFPGLSAEELKEIHVGMDFMGHNYYQSHVVRKGEGGLPERMRLPAGYPESAMGWPIQPDGLYWTIRYHYERYKLPCAITENGMASLDWVDSNGEVLDGSRADFIRGHLRAVHRAIEEGYPVEGYFHWSLMDNFEWAEGYHKRFGLIHVDFETQKRTIKHSGKVYAEIIKRHGANLFEPTLSLA